MSQVEGKGGQLQDAATLAVIHCKWDYCSETFLSFSEWQTHFTVEHIAYAQPIDLRGRHLRKRKVPGEWELLDSDPRPANQLPLDPHPSQTTGDITTTTHTLSFPIPPSFQSLPEIPANMNLSHQQAAFPNQLERSIQDPENDARLYQSFLRSPSPELVRSGSISASGSGSVQPPPPGQRAKTPPWTPSQLSAFSQHGIHSASNPNPTPAHTTSPNQPSQSSSQSHATPSRDGRSQPSSQQASNPAGPQATQGNVPLRFGAALGKGEDGSPFKESPTAKGRGVGFNWGGSA
ncbi:hypothetical protein I302_100153 [Kwoniella bestiolae CBS 10118]|uniref:Uncharacterized protein n=1 Tax=Kwoniella bestiolae CBS 10118 TaxID=1296100 RepID=A0A1B9G494_9TREE|nr:hypothetical protein I302_03528 [Kwoniella bestiolae CBS 10118]OCF25854.1 hypothetical protein I302_03528 [Kwoniella bestiolae CBS 10118]